MLFQLYFKVGGLVHVCEDINSVRNTSPCTSR
jgi:hypothetical protein